MPGSDLEKIVLKLKKGDEKAFKEFFNSLYPSLLNFARRFVKTDVECKDIVQNAFISYWERHQDFNNYHKICSYLYVVVRNSSINHLRNTANRKILDAKISAEEQQEFNSAMIEEEAMRRINMAVNALPPQMRKVILLSLEGHKNAEIANLMSISVLSVNTYKRDAYKKLRILLKRVDFFLLLLLS